MIAREVPERRLLDVVLGVSLHTRGEDALRLKMGAFKTLCNDGRVEEHALIYHGEIREPPRPILFRINSACYAGDIFHCSRCDCNLQLLTAMQLISKQGGLIVYDFNHEGRGAGFTEKTRVYGLMESLRKSSKEIFSLMGKAPDVRDFSASLLILQYLGITQVIMIGDNAEKRDCLLGGGIDIVDVVSLKKGTDK